MTSNKLYFAPFQGITTPVFRSVWTKHFRGIDKIYTPFLNNIFDLKRLKSKQKDELSYVNINKVKVIPQILSKSSSEIISFANICNSLGFDEINWNLGCPFSRVANRGRGSGLLYKPAEIDEILSKVFNEININLSIKCRVGYYNENEIFEILPIFEKYPINELIIHPRIGKQLYNGTANKEIFLQVINKYQKEELVYNGDIFYSYDLKILNKTFPSINVFMLGRGLLSNPFLAEDIKGINNIENREVRIKKFLDDLLYEYCKTIDNQVVVTNILKELWRYISQSFDDINEAFNLIKRCNNINDYQEGVKSVFATRKWISI